MRHNSQIAVVVVTFFLFLAPAKTFAQTSCDSQWSVAAAMEDAGRWGAAEQVYLNIIRQCPDSQRAQAKLGFCQLKAGRPNDAQVSLEAAIAMQPFGYWAEVGLFYHARSCLEANCEANARESIQLLRRRFPSSVYVSRAGIIEAQLDGNPSDVANLTYQTERLIAQEFDEITQESSPLDTVQQIMSLQTLIDTYPESATAIRSKETLGHLLIREGRRTEATDVFSELLLSLDDETEQSRIALNTKMRLAALYHSQRNKRDAFKLYRELADTSSNPIVRSNAAIQAAGIHMEFNVDDYFAAADTSDALGPREIQGGATPSTPQLPWGETRRLCHTVLSLQDAKPDDVVRAQIIILESYHWQRDTTRALDAARTFIESYSRPEADGVRPQFRKELAMAHLVAGECLQQLDGHQDALVHYRWIAQEFGEEEIWPGLTNLQRTYTRIFEALMRAGAPEDEVAEAADFVLTKWPDSQYAELIRWARGER